MHDDSMVARVLLGTNHAPTGGAQHAIGGSPMPTPQELRILKADEGFYLLYCNAEGEPMTDTFHLALDDAFDQAEFEFRVDRADWTIVQ
jgi:hypothetical protein